MTTIWFKHQKSFPGNSKLRTFWRSLFRCSTIFPPKYPKTLKHRTSLGKKMIWWQQSWSNLFYYCKYIKEKLVTPRATIEHMPIICFSDFNIQLTGILELICITMPITDHTILQLANNNKGCSQKRMHVEMIRMKAVTR